MSTGFHNAAASVLVGLATLAGCSSNVSDDEVLVPAADADEPGEEVVVPLPGRVIGQGE